MGKSGFYKGRHYTDYVDKVKELKRAGEYAEAVALLLQLIDAVEQEANVEGWAVAPWYYEQLAIIYHKQKVFDAEVSILERFAQVNTGDHPLLNRLAKAKGVK